MQGWIQIAMVKWVETKKYKKKILANEWYFDGESIYDKDIII